MPGAESSSITFVNGSVPPFVIVPWMVIADPAALGVLAPSSARAAGHVFRPTAGPPGSACHEGSSQDATAASSP